MSFAMEKRKASKLDIALVVADFLFNTHRYRKAIDFYKEAHELLNGSKVENCNSLKMLLHHQLTRAYASINEFQEVLVNFQQVLKITKEIRDKATEATGFNWSYHASAQPFQAIFCQSKILKSAKETGDKQREGGACVVIAHAYSSLGKQDKFIEFENEALRICREIGEKRGEGTVLRDLGSVHKVLAQYHKAVCCLEQSQKILKDIGDYRGEAASYLLLGSTYHEIGEFDKALDFSLKSLKLMTVHGGGLADVGACYNNIGAAYHALSRNSEAIEYFEKTVDIMRKLGHRKLEGIAHQSLGLCYQALGQYRKAIEHQEMAMDSLKETGDRMAQGRSFSVLGQIYYAIGQYKSAIKFFESALKVSQEIGDRNLESNAYSGLGAVYYALDSQSGKAGMYARKALEISKETGNKRELATNYINLALIYSNNDQYKESLESHDCAIEIMKEMGDKRGEATALICLASVYEALGQLKRAVEVQRKGLDLLREVGDAGREHVALLSLGIYTARDEGSKEACEYLFESISCIERDREQLQDEHKLSLDNTTFRNYWVLYTHLLIQGNVPEALCTAERGRARALVDLMSEKYGLQERRDSNAVYVNGLKHLSIRNQSTFIFTAVVYENIFFWIIEKGNIRFRLSKLKSGEEGIADLLSLPKKQLLHFSSASIECEDRSLSAYYKMLSSPGERRRREGKDQRLVEEEEEKTKKEESSLHLLYERLIAPVADLLQRQDIIIVPEGDLFMVPFPALQDANGKFLSETFRIRLIPSLTTLQLIQSSPEDFHCRTGALIVGDPAVHPKTRLPPLPEARKEAQEIAELLGVTAIVGNQATKEAILRKMQGVSLIHFAAHGDAERGEIALSPSCSSDRIPSKKDFMLNIGDIAKVGIRAKLVVLSCCHSGRGEIMKSEGVVGVSRAFLASGARCVLVSLWQLDDKSTKEFIIRFYGHLVRDKLSASEALHQSMKWMRHFKKYSVSDWAPFVLIGDDVTLDL
ncbi:uncharacterized protein LOC144656485 isoform X2 [Oculina patagonica]